MIAKQRVVNSPEAKCRYFDTFNVLVDANLLVIVFHIFVSKHLNVDMLVDVVHASAVSFYRLSELPKVVFAHVGL